MFHFFSPFNILFNNSLVEIVVDHFLHLLPKRNIESKEPSQWFSYQDIKTTFYYSNVHCSFLTMICNIMLKPGFLRVLKSLVKVKFCFTTRYLENDACLSPSTKLWNSLVCLIHCFPYFYTDRYLPIWNLISWACNLKRVVWEKVY